MLRINVWVPSTRVVFSPKRNAFASHIPYHVAGRSYVGPLAIILKTFECLSPSEIMQGAK